MGVSYRGERMIGNLPFSLFMGRKEKKKEMGEKENTPRAENKRKE